jgi:hypothetical protein
MTKLHKLVQDGKVAVLYSPEFGSGWYTWNGEYPQLIFDPAIVNYVENESWSDLEVYMELKYPRVHLGGLLDLKVQWVAEGTEFKIVEYDGYESIEYKNSDQWITA